MTPESRIKQKLKAYLDAMGCYYFMPVPTGYGQTTLDFLVCFPGCRFIAIETKAPGGQPTRRQSLVIDRIRKAGGVVYVVDYEVPPLRATVTGKESWYPAFAEEGADIRRDQESGGEPDND